jgi:hypothetical protein
VEEQGRSCWECRASDHCRYDLLLGQEEYGSEEPETDAAEAQTIAVTYSYPTYPGHHHSYIRLMMDQLGRQSV